MFDRIAEWCVAWSVGHASSEECDRLGMSEAQRLAASRAVDGLECEVDAVLVDGKWDFIGGGNTTTIVKGDQKSLSIASASILAKVTRDRIMREESTRFPGYNFAANKGYPCPIHKQALADGGPTVIHRTSWAFMDWAPGERYRRPTAQTTLF